MSNPDGTSQDATAPEPVVDMFTPPPREAPRPGAPPGTGPVPLLPQGSSGPPERPRSWMLPAAVLAVLTSAVLGLAVVAALAQGAPRPANPVPTFATPTRADLPAPRDAAPPATTSRRPDDGEPVTDVTVAVTTVDPGTAVELPGAGSRDWVAPGVSGDGGLVRADRDEESIEFRAANTQPGRNGPFAVSWSAGTVDDVSGDSADMLGIRPGGRVEFVLRPLDEPGELVVLVSGDDVGITVGTEDGSTRSTVSASAGVVTVALPAGTAATVTVAPAGDDDIGVVSAELR